MSVGNGRSTSHQGQVLVALHFMTEEDVCLCARQVCSQSPAWAPLCYYLVIENITCLARCYFCSALKSGTLINYYSKVLIKHQSKAGLLGWGLR